MRAILWIALALAMVGGSAAAQGLDRGAAPTPPVMDRPFKLALPADWRSEPELSKRTREHLARADLFGGIAYSAGADSFFGAPGFGFHVTWAGGLSEVKDGPATVRAEIDRIKRSWCGDGDRVRDSFVEATKDDVVEARLVWRHTEDGTVTVVKALAFVTRDGRPRVIQTTCDLRVDVEKELRPICERIVETLEITSADRMSLAGLPASTVGEGCPAAVPAGLEVPTENIVPTPTGRMGEPPAGAPSAPGVLYTGEGGEREGDSNRKWLMLLGAGLLILAIYLTTRSRRDEPERQEEVDARDEEDGNGNQVEDDEGPDDDQEVEK
ncbi:MAG TPA: hypothetical protein VML75_19465 [Kofleriaceae bacterium]|nr:hypothetical protein [Kofleriaceae bacterium]